MSEPMELRIFHGNGEISRGPYGVDLSNFQETTIEHPNPEGTNIRDVISWLLAYFQLDPRVCSMTVQCLCLRFLTPVRFQLMVADQTYKWRKWVEWCRRCQAGLNILVQPCPKELAEGDSSLSTPAVGESRHWDEVSSVEQLPIRQLGDFYGQADAGEKVEQIIDELDNVDHNAIHEEETLMQSANSVADRDEDDEERETSNIGGSSDPVTDECNRPNRATTGIMENQQSPRQCGLIRVNVNQQFRSQQELKNAVSRWAVTSFKEVLVKTSSPGKYGVKCRTLGCSFYVHAYKPKYETHWIASKVVDHSCTLQNFGRKHRNLTVSLDADELFDEIIDKSDKECSFIQRAINQRFKYEITYQKAWQAKQKAREMRWGTYEASYCNLPRVLEILKERNPGTYTAFKETVTEEDQPRTFRRAFFSLGPCIQSFQHCRPLLCMDGSFLTGKYKGHILTAVGVDADNHILPLAFAFVEGENRLSWLWFMRHLKAGVVQDRPNICIIHNCHDGILSAIKTLQEDPCEPYPWPDLQSRWCMRYMGANFYKKFKSKRLMNMFKKLCSQNQTRKFNALWEELDRLTRAHIQELSKKPLIDDDNVTEALPPLGQGLDPPNVRRSVRKIKCFSHWIETEPRDKWALLFDTDGARFGVMTTNLPEVYNWVMRDLRGLPLIGIVAGILYGITGHYQKRHTAAVLHSTTMQTPYCFRMMKHLDKKNKKASQHTVHYMDMDVDEHHFQITLRAKEGVGMNTRTVTHEVKLGQQFNGSMECTCNKPKLLHLPCSHVLASVAQVNAPSRPYVSTFYCKKRVVLTWAKEIYGFMAHGNFTVYNSDMPICLPPMELLRQTHAKGTRPLARGICNDMDEATCQSGCEKVSSLCGNRIGPDACKCVSDIAGQHGGDYSENTTTPLQLVGSSHDGFSSKKSSGKKTKPTAHKSTNTSNCIDDQSAIGKEGEEKEMRKRRK